MEMDYTELSLKQSFQTQWLIRTDLLLCNQDEKKEDEVFKKETDLALTKNIEIKVKLD
jgi:hypothetical protein